MGLLKARTHGEPCIIGLLKFRTHGAILLRATRFFAAVTRFNFLRSKTSVFVVCNVALKSCIVCSAFSNPPMSKFY